MDGNDEMLKKVMSCICFIYKFLQKYVIGSYGSQIWKAKASKDLPDPEILMALGLTLILQKTGAHGMYLPP